MNMAAAQARHDAAELPEPATCRFCDDQGVVDATEVKDAGGVRHSFSKDTEPPAAPCPVCVVGLEIGVEVLA